MNLWRWVTHVLVQGCHIVKFWCANSFLEHLLALIVSRSAWPSAGTDSSGKALSSISWSSLSASSAAWSPQESPHTASCSEPIHRPSHRDTLHKVVNDDLVQQCSLRTVCAHDLPRVQSAACGRRGYSWLSGGMWAFPLDTPLHHHSCARDQVCTARRLRYQTSWKMPLFSMLVKAMLECSMPTSSLLNLVAHRTKDQMSVVIFGTGFLQELLGFLTARCNELLEWTPQLAFSADVDVIRLLWWTPCDLPNR